MFIFSWGLTVLYESMKQEKPERQQWWVHIQCSLFYNTQLSGSDYVTSNVGLLAGKMSNTENKQPQEHFFPLIGLICNRSVTWSAIKEHLRQRFSIMQKTLYKLCNNFRKMFLNLKMKSLWISHHLHNLWPIITSEDLGNLQKSPYVRDKVKNHACKCL